MRSQENRYWEEKDAEAGDEDESLSGSGSGSGSDSHSDSDQDDTDARGNTSGSVPLWPQSYRQSMDMYSTLQSPSVNLFSPGLHHRLSSSHLGSAYSSYQTLPSDGPKATSGTQPLRIPFLQPGQKEEESVLPYSDPIRNLEDQFLRPDSVYVPEVVKAPGCSFLQGLFNGMNVLAGVGVLTTPFALKEAGWIGVLYLCMLSVICFYTGILLRRCLESEAGLATYPDIGQAAFGQIGRILISIILYTELYACCVEFLILEGDNLSALFPGVHVSIGGFHIHSKTCFCLLTAMFVLPTVLLRDLSYLSYVSAGGVIASIVVTISVLWVGALDGVGFHETGPLFKLSGLPVSIGLYGFCYSGHAVFPNIYSSLRNRNDYNKVLGVSFTLCTVLYAGMAVMGFKMFGSETASQITLNLPKQFLASRIAVWTTVVNPFTKFALTMTPVALSLEELLPMGPESMKHRSASIAIRTALVLSTIGVAVLVPFFGFVMAFIGSFLSMTVSLILPCACYLAIFGKKVSVLQAMLCVTVMLIGSICLLLGTYSSVSGIIASYSDLPKLLLDLLERCYSQLPVVESHAFKLRLRGMRKEDVSVQVEDDRTLYISYSDHQLKGEERAATFDKLQKHGFMRKFKLPENAEVEQIRAEVADETLTVTVPKRKMDARKVIEVSEGADLQPAASSTATPPSGECSGTPEASKPSTSTA